MSNPTHQDAREQAIKMLSGQDLVIVRQALDLLHDSIDHTMVRDPLAYLALERLQELAAAEDNRRIMMARNAAMAMTLNVPKVTLAS